MQDAEHKALSTYDVIRCYEVMLGRVPENTSVVASHLHAATDQRDLVLNIARSAEFAARIGVDLTAASAAASAAPAPSPSPAPPPSPFWHYNASIDVREIIERHAHPHPTPLPGHFVNFLGAAIPVKIMPFLKDFEGRVDHIPIPANFHADMAEWAGALRAVDLARDSFTMIELGCGWACWMTNSGVAARARGLRVELIGIEGDPTHLEYAHETMAVNGFTRSEYTLLQGVAAATAGFALFPRRIEGDEHWGPTPIFGATTAESEKAAASGRYDSLTMVPLAQAIGLRPKIDLLHMDIQGGEADLVAATLGLLTERVAYVVIGTHQRQLEGRLLDLMLGAGWSLEIERPAILQVHDGVPTTTVDGVQSWRNPRFNASA